MSDADTAINDFGPIADVYDELVSWAPYGRWVEDLESRLRGYGLEPGARLLDAACGTGLSTLPWLEKGYRVTAVDRSERALELAREKVGDADYPVEFYRRDLRELDLEGPFDAAVCMHSGLDYILEEDELRRALAELRRVLRQGGLLSFDKCIHRDEFYRRPVSSHRRLSVGEAVMRYRWDRENRLMEQNCTIVRGKGGDEESRTRVKFLMRAFTVDELVDMVQGAGFEVLEPPRPFTVADPGMGIYRAT